MSRFTILLGGRIRRTSRIDKQIAGSRVIAADSGIRHAGTLDLVPELWVGDFDSAPEGMVEKYSDVPRAVFPAAKDKTDGEIAIDTALRLGATALVLVGPFGGARPDHVYLHLAQAVALAEAGVPTLLVSGGQEACPLLTGPRHTFDYEDGTLFSILAFTHLSGLTVGGAKWPLDAVEVPFGSSLTISNEVKGNLVVTLRHGRALLLADFIAQGTN